MANLQQRVLVIANELPGLPELFRSLAATYPKLEIKQVASVDAAIPLLPGFRPQVLLLDVPLLGNDATGVLRKLRRVWPAVSCLALVGNADEFRQAEQLPGIDDSLALGKSPNPAQSRIVAHAFRYSRLLATALLTQRSLRTANARIDDLEKESPADNSIGKQDLQNNLDLQLGQAQKMEALGQLTGGLAHDFNNLLAVIIGNLQLVQRSVASNEKAAKQVVAALDAATRGAKLTRQMLSVARRQPLEPRALTMTDVLGDFAEILYRTLGGAIKVDIRVSPDCKPVMADPSLLESAVLNLAINARDAMPDGGKLCIAVNNLPIDDCNAGQYPELSPGAYISLSVSDEGVGIPPAVLARVTEPFFTTKAPGSGTGLGLSMVHSFAAQSGGHFELMSRQGKGTTATLYLPGATTTDIEQTMATQTRLQAIPNGEEKILLVEDDETVRDVARSMLEGLGYSICEASNADSALAVLRDRNDFDLLFTDVVMPGSMDGVELGQQVRRLHPAIKVLHTSGYIGSHSDKEVSNDVQPFLGKPYKFDALAAKVREVLDAEATARISKPEQV